MDLNEFPLQNRKLQIGKIAFTKISNYGRIVIMKCTGSRINGIPAPHPRDQCYNGQRMNRKIGKTKFQNL